MIEWIKDHAAAVVIGSVIIIAAVLITLALVKHDETGTIVSKSWTRTISLQKFDWVHHSEDSSFAPEGAINIHRWTESRHYTTTETYKDSEGKTHERSIDHTKWVDCISYDVREWIFSRDVVKSSNSPHDIPTWPEYTLNSNPQEKEGNRSEQYTISLKIKENSKSYHPTLQQFNDMTIDKNVNCTINGFGAVVAVNF